MPNGLVIKHRTRGYLADFDPWGKQEFVWTVDIKGAWVFGSEQDANAAIRWMPRENQLSIKRLLPVTSANKRATDVGGARRTPPAV